MITGSVRSDEPRIRLKLIGRGGVEEEVNAIIDTGYTGTLTLPSAVISVLGLRFRAMEQAELADGSSCVFRSFNGEALWDGKLRKILVDEADTDPLVGMRLLRGHELKVQVRYRGRVTIKRLKSK